MCALRCFTVAFVTCVGCGTSGPATSGGSTTMLADRLAAANGAHQPLVVELGAAWCKPCHDFADRVLTDARVQAELRGIVFVQYDIDTASGADAAKRCSVVNVPAVVRVAPDGSTQPLTAGSEPTIEDFVAFLQQTKARSHAATSR